MRAHPPLPYTPGSDAAGTVAEVGDGGREFHVGDRVYTSGTMSGAYAEFALCETAQVHRLPERVTPLRRARPWGRPTRRRSALFSSGAGGPGETVLVHGASGGVGTAAVQLARAHGLRVLGTAGTGQGRPLVREQGAEAVSTITRRIIWRDYEVTAGRGVDVILELPANVNLGKDLAVLAPGGRVVVIGNRGKVEIDPREAMARDADIRGMVLSNAPAEE